MSKIKKAFLIIFGLFLLIFLVVYNQVSRDIKNANWHVIEDAVPSETHPLAGFWKSDCSDQFGLAIGPFDEKNYYISFCGPGGCFDKGEYRTNTTIVDDCCYVVQDNNTIDVEGKNGFTKYHRCQ